MLLFNRFLSGARSVISLFAGITSMNTVRVAIYSFISCLVWNMFLVFAGCKVGENWGSVSEFLKKYNAVVMFVLAVLLVVFLIVKKQKKSADHLP